MIAQLRARPALMESGVIDKLSALHVPVLFVDYEICLLYTSDAADELLHVE